MWQSTRIPEQSPEGLVSLQPDVSYTELRIGIALLVQPANNAVAGAVVGAVLGALLGSAAGLNGHQTGQIAALSAVNGGVQGLAWGSAEWQAVVNRCMVGRGYNVLN
jgi:outer membrane lipoprotein SlyB